MVIAQGSEFPQSAADSPRSLLRSMEQIGKPGDVRCDPSRFIAGQSVHGHAPSGFVFEINVIGHKSTLLAVPTRRSIRRHHRGSIEYLPAVSDDAHAPMIVASGVIIAADDPGFRIADKAIAILRDDAATPIGVARRSHTCRKQERKQSDACHSGLPLQ
jgi:hypothetical protein